MTQSNQQSNQWKRGDDVWVRYAEGPTRGRYAGCENGLHYVQLDGDDFARPVGDPRWMHNSREEAVAKWVNARLCVACRKPVRDLAEAPPLSKREQKAEQRRLEKRNAERKKLRLIRERGEVQS